MAIDDALTEAVLGAVFAVANGLGCGFLEKVYERALVVELGARGLRVRAQAPCPVRYRGRVVGEYFADLLVEGELVLELKCVERLGSEHLAQCLNYLKATRLRRCLLVNFGRPRVEFKRIVRDEDALSGTGFGAAEGSFGFGGGGADRAAVGLPEL